MSKHTPTPWALDKYGDVVHSAKGQVCITGFALSCGPRNKEAEANAHHIVKAVNYHDRLREALHRCVDGWLKSDDVFAPMQEARALLAELDNLEPKP